MREHMPHMDTRVAAISTAIAPFVHKGSTIVEAGDEVFFVAASPHIRAVMSELQRLEKPYKRIMLVGGGNIGAGLARRLEKDYSVRLIERNQQRAAELAEKLQNPIVSFGDASDKNCWAKTSRSSNLFLPSPTMTRPCHVRHACRTYGCEKVMVSSSVALM